MIKGLICQFALLILSGIVIGCTSSDTGSLNSNISDINLSKSGIVGKWRGIADDTFEFSEDYTCIYTVFGKTFKECTWEKIEENLIEGEVSMGVLGNFKAEIDGDSIFVFFTGIEVTDVKEAEYKRVH